MARKKRKLNFKRLFIFIFLPLLFIMITLFILLSNFPFMKNTLEYIGNSVSQLSIPNLEYDIIKIDNNSKYLGIGQEKVQDKDGYFTTFTTTNENKKVYLEYKQNGDSSWKDNLYWENTMETDGCGITALSIILSGYNKNVTPEDLRKNYYPVLKSDNIPSELCNSFGIESSGFFYDSVHLSNEYIKEYLNTNRPILVCVWNKAGHNRWTTDSHYMVLLATDGDNMVYVSNPNGLENTSKSSGWYDINEVTKYLAKALFIEDYIEETFLKEISQRG